MSRTTRSERGWKRGRALRGPAALWAAVLVAGAFTGMPALAQDADGDPAESETPQYTVQEEVFVEHSPSAIPTANTVAAKLPLSLDETPASVSVIPGPLLEEQDAFILGDALENSAGVNVQRGNGIFDFFVIRGLDSLSSGLILTDGAPEPESTAYQLYNVERVEVLKGPGSFVYGGGPLGSVVNLVRKQPEGHDFTRLSLSGGSYSTYEGSVDSNWASDSGKASFRLNGLWQQSDGYRDGMESETWAVNPAFTFRPSDRTTLNLNLETASIDYMPDSGLPLVRNGDEILVPDVPRTRSYQSPFDVSDQDVLRFQVDVESRINDHFVLRNKTFYRSLDWQSAGTLFNGTFTVPGPTTAASRSFTELDDEQAFAGNQLEAVLRFETGAVTHNLLAGLEVARRTDEFTFDVGFLPDILVFDPVESASQPVPSIPGQAFAADTTADIVSPYLIDQISFGPRFQVLAGVRWDNLDFEDKVSGNSDSYDQVSPLAGVVFSPREGLSLYANWGQAFAPPSTFVARERRVPEESEQWEAGVKTSFAEDRVHLSLAYFQVERTNIAVPDDSGILRQTGDQEAQGFEIELAARPARGWSVQAAYAYTDAELTDFQTQIFLPFPPFVLGADLSGNTPAFTPEHMLNLWATRRFECGFGLGLGGRYVSEQEIAENNQFQIEDYGLLNASLFYEAPGTALGAHWRAHLTLKNLTDEEYFTRGVGSTSVIPAPGFHAMAGFTLGF